MIIGLVGLAGSGKSTVAEHIQSKYGYTRLNFKDGLVAEMKDRLGLVLDELVKLMDKTAFDGRIENQWNVDRLFRDKPPLMRALMQSYGTEVRRADDKDYWVNKWKDIAYTEPVKNFVTDDVRFLNEAEAVKDAGGKILRIVRTDIVAPMNHQSETEQFNIVHDLEIICGPGEHDKLYSLIDQFIESYEGN